MVALGKQSGAASVVDTLTYTIAYRGLPYAAI